MKLLLFIPTLYFAFIQIANSQSNLFDKYCDKITSEVDKFTGEKTYKTPILKQVVFYKVIKDGSVTVYMRLSTIGSTPPTGNGVIILLENGEKITKDVETSVNVNSAAQFEHSAFFSLSQADIELLKKHRITDARLYIFDMKIRQPDQYWGYINCLEGMK